MTHQQQHRLTVPHPRHPESSEVVAPHRWRPADVSDHGAAGTGPDMTSRIAQLTLDVVDPDRMAEFWSLALGYRVVPDEGRSIHRVPPDDAPAEDLDG
jgi:Glyoxalase-like domain